MSLKSLIVISTIISYLGCAAAPKKELFVASTTVDYEQPASQKMVLGFREIDSENPPVEGLWTTWDEAIFMANALREERIKNETKIAVISKERDIAKYQMGMYQKQLIEDNSPAKKWWLTWGFPIGVGIGTILGVVVPIVITGASK